MRGVPAHGSPIDIRQPARRKFRMDSSVPRTGHAAAADRAATDRQKGRAAEQPWGHLSHKHRVVHTKRRWRLFVPAARTAAARCHPQGWPAAKCLVRQRKSAVVHRPGRCLLLRLCFYKNYKEEDRTTGMRTSGPSRARMQAQGGRSGTAQVGRHGGCPDRATARGRKAPFRGSCRGWAPPCGKAAGGPLVRSGRPVCRLPAAERSAAPCFQPPGACGAEFSARECGRAESLPAPLRAADG